MPSRCSLLGFLSPALKSIEWRTVTWPDVTIGFVANQVHLRYPRRTQNSIKYAGQQWSLEEKKILVSSRWFVIFFFLNVSFFVFRRGFVVALANVSPGRWKWGKNTRNKKNKNVGWSCELVAVECINLYFKKRLTLTTVCSSGFLDYQFQFSARPGSLMRFEVRQWE